ncbi:hypothetical protein CLPUN_06810 [Clostridium puniceum]|uniref:Uncharacterized protein n=1 Tax=Clostridium puniceum TaxID=29367 RepID=A0A1S8TW46_9CLOT|nr:hypothetical protein [Clostridium puniceum]OOM81966.1 hypothetical protein CLPUN_06810 [Clostridium puniceum]
MKIAKKKVILPLLSLVLFTCIFVQTPSVCYAGTWKSFTQSFGSASTIYTNQFSMNGQGISINVNASPFYSGNRMKVTLQYYDSSNNSWNDSGAEPARYSKNGETQIYNWSHTGTWRFKIEYDESVRSTTVKVDYFVY